MDGCKSVQIQICECPQTKGTSATENIRVVTQFHKLSEAINIFPAPTIMSLSPEVRALLFDNESDDSDDEMFQKVVFKPSNKMTAEEEDEAAKRERWDMIADDWNHDMSDPLVRAKKKFEEEQEKAAKKKPRKSVKKKNSTPKITKFYKKEKNWQGKPMKNCKYEHSVKSYVFRPPKYEKKSDAEYLGYKKDFCDKCLLKPCMTAEFHSEIFDFGHDKEHNEHSPMDEVQASVEAFGMTCLHPHLGKRYVAKMSVPKCLAEFVRCWYPVEKDTDTTDKLSEEDDDSNAEAEDDCDTRHDETDSEEEENEF